MGKVRNEFNRAALPAGGSKRQDGTAGLSLEVQKPKEVAQQIARDRGAAIHKAATLPTPAKGPSPGP